MTTSSDSASVTLLLSGDVMTGRGVDQILPSPGDPALHESFLRDARRYVQLAEAVNGPMPRPVDHTWPWGDALEVIRSAAADLWLVNLETSITTSDDYEPGKAVHYRMNPANAGCLTAARIDACTLANNHVLDFGVAGLVETLEVLEAAGIATLGAGRNESEARSPLRVAAEDTSIAVFAFGMPSSGVPARWAASDDHPGVNVIRADSDRAVRELVGEIEQAKQDGEVVVVSVHWGSNWGYGVSRSDVRLARRLVDAGADVVHGHSSHHPRPIEIYRGRLVLYGCGDFVDDYEGISGYEDYRDDLRLLYRVRLDATTGAVSALEMMPFQARQMRLHRASDHDVRWLADVLDRISRPFGARVSRQPDGTLAVLAVG